MKKKAEQFMARQGDVLITRVRSIPRDAKKRARDNGRVILAYGEATGHAHAIADSPAKPRAELFDVLETELTFLCVDEVSHLVHDEHGTIELAPGNYQITRQREYAPEAPRYVGD